ncbi:MAG: 30S ribosome-binding factor RbfA [Pseudomonadales bacterium]
MSRDLKVADFIRDEVARIIQFEMRDPRVGSFVSVNEVKVSKDLSYADIYVSSLQADNDKARGELITVLNKAAGFFRSTLAKRHSMRTTPKPRFHYDELIEKAPQLEELIAQAVAGDRPENADDDAEGEPRG